MIRISQMALAACLALSALNAEAFTTAPVSIPTSRQSSSSIVPTSIVAPIVTSIQSTTQLSLSTTDSSSSSSSSLKRLPDSAVELTLSIPAKSTSAAYDKILSTVAKQISIPGFRKGAKIPPAVIENAWSKNGGKKNLKTMAINELCGELIGPALKDEFDLEPIGQPTLVTPADVLAEKFVPGEEVEVVVKCDVWPDIQWKSVEGKEKPYLGLTGSYKRKPFNQERFDMALRDLTERYARLEPYEDGDERELAMGDACVVNMVGYMANGDGSKGEPLPDAASGDNVEVILGSGRYMDGLVEGLVGGKVGEVKTVNVRFPDALRNKDLAGKQAIFDVEILSASKRILPELTDEFANQVRPGLTVESLKDELRKAVDSQDAQEYMGARNEALGKALSEIMDVDVPDTLITNQAREKYAIMMTDMRNNGMPDEEIKKMISPENFLKYKDISKEGIVRDFKVSMALDEIARLEGITVPAYQIDEQMQSLKDQAAKEGQSDEVDDESMRRKVESTLERRMVYDFLAENANLNVEYADEEQFDEALLEQLAQESLAREQQAAEASGKEDGEVAVIDESAPVAAASATETVEVDEKAEEPAAVVETPVPVSAPAADMKKQEAFQRSLLTAKIANDAKISAALKATKQEKFQRSLLAAKIANDSKVVVASPAAASGEGAPLVTSSELDASKYEGMTLEEKAFQILVDLNAVELHTDPDE